MARTIRDSKLETRAARDRLAPGKRPHWKTLVPGALHLGYRRKRKDAPGQWLARHYKGDERYLIRPLGLADDFEDVPARPAPVEGSVLTFAEAQRLAHAQDWGKPKSSQSKGGLTVADVVQSYIEWLRLNRSTAEDAERRAETLILPVLGTIPVAELTTDKINAWLKAMAEKPARVRSGYGKQNYKPAPATKQQKRARKATANRTLTTLKAALNRAFRNGDVADDKAWRRVQPFDKTHAARPDHLSIAEATRLINAANSESGFRDLIHAALLTGCRYGELRSLQVRDFQHGKLHVRESKSGKPRHVVLTEESIEFFEQLTAGRPASDWLLVNRNRDGQWQKSDQGKAMRAACKHAKIDPPIGIHALRHSYASLSVMAGMPMAVLAYNLGHAGTSMIEKHYGHLRDDYIAREIKAAAPRFGITIEKKVVPIR
jgi:integrase